MKNTGEALELIWVSNTEQNTDRFEIQWSPDGRDFTTIDEEKAQGNSLVKTTYQYVISTPEEGEQYFRLKQVDLDGSASFSPIRGVVFFSIKEKVGSVYPNPIIQSKVRVDVLADYKGHIELAVYCQQGTLIRSQRVNLDNGYDRVEIDLSGLESAYYWLLFDMPDGPVYRKVFIP